VHVPRLPALHLKQLLEGVHKVQVDVVPVAICPVKHGKQEPERKEKCDWQVSQLPAVQVTQPLAPATHC